MISAPLQCLAVAGLIFIGFVYHMLRAHWSHSQRLGSLSRYFLLLTVGYFGVEASLEDNAGEQVEGRQDDTSSEHLVQGSAVCSDLPEEN